MKRKSCQRCEVTPTQPGYYWATCRKYPNWPRVIVKVGKNGHGHTRVFVIPHSGSFGLEEFGDWNGPITEKKRS